MPSCALGALTHVADCSADVVRKRPAVRVAQHQRFGSRLLCGREDPQREFRVLAVAVEEVLRIEEDTQVVLAQVTDGVGHHGDRFVERRAKCFGDMAVPGFGHDACHRGTGIDQVGQHNIVFGLHPGPARRPEGDQRGGAESQLLLGACEELDVLWVGPGPTSFNEGDAQVVELLGHPKLVVDGERQPLLLAAVTQDGVEDVDRLGQLGHGEVMRVRTVSVGVHMRESAVAVRRRATTVSGAGSPGTSRGFPVTRHDPTSPCTGPPRRAPRRSTSAGSPW